MVQCNAESTKKFTPSGIAVDGLSPTSPKVREEEARRGEGKLIPAQDPYR